MHRTTKLVLAVTAIFIVLLGFGALEYAWLTAKPPAPLPIGQRHPAARIPTASPAVSPPAAPAHPSSPSPPAGVAPAAPAGAPVIDPRAAATTVTYVVEAHDTLWDLAGAHLGNPLRWQELYDLNRGRLEPGGQALQNSNLICPGWTLQFPADATGFPAPQTPAASSGGGSA